MSANTKSPYQHKRGIHCITTAMANILSGENIDLSEELCFGIGSGLGFTYTRGKSIEQYLVFGRSDDLELNLCEMLGIYAKLSHEPDSDMALEHLMKKKAANELVIVDLDISKLAYLTEALKWPETSSHGGHKAVFGGYDRKTDEVFLYEYLWLEPQRMKREDFFQAWNSFNGLAPARNLWYEFIFPNSTVPLETAIKKGIQMNVYRMLSPWNKFHGMEGLKAFLRAVPNWPYLFQEEDRRKLAYASYVSLEIGGTGKGAFRKMFSRFLKKAAHSIHDEALREVAKDYLQLATLWSELATLLFEGSEDPNSGIFSGSRENETLTEEIYAKEKQAIHRLFAISENWG
ncbi:BtrH N-terminal domain-containing protein [Siminovitchia sp. FSL H7-0308]|uniref:BtrH N-terminal domain-containing protein n=1 Tax=Siminovitchia sp. FSL H7-0308 TaxID=2921432 RepID=UPI0030ED178A